MCKYHKENCNGKSKEYRQVREVESDRTEQTGQGVSEFNEIGRLASGRPARR